MMGRPPGWGIPPGPVPSARWTGGELLGYREWHLARWGPDGGLRLCSLTRLVLWDGPVVRADHTPLAEPLNQVGLYARKPSCRPRRQPKGHDWRCSGTAWIWGWVALSGQVVEHAHGYRAERMVVRRLRLGVGVLRSLFKTGGDPQAVARELSDRYQVPVKVGQLEQRLAIDSLCALPEIRPRVTFIGHPMAVDEIRVYWPQEATII